MKKTNLKQWLFNKPILFTLMFIGLSLAFSIIHSLISMVITIESSIFLYLMFGFSFIYSAYYMIKKLPHDKMYRNDLIAIVNGSAFISILFSLLVLFVPNNPDIGTKAAWFSVMHPTIFSVGIIVITFIVSYLAGLAISSIYAKYKRCVEMGISPWKIILSMPFTFLMLWTPGYLIEEKTNKSNLTIKSQWFSKLHKFVLKNFNNTLSIFLLIILLKLNFGLLTTLLTLSLLIIYALWYTKHKSDFVKNINKGYALTAVGINIAIILAMLL